MKEKNDFDQDPHSSAERPPAEIGNDWEDDEASLESTEDQWCIVSDSDVNVQVPKGGLPPKVNSWDEPEHASSKEASFDKRKLSLENMVPPSIKKPKNMLVLLHLLVGVLVVIHLAWDRYAWRSSAIHFEQELRLLKVDPIAEQSARGAPGVEEGPRRHVSAEHDDLIDFDSIEWIQSEELPDNVILDNCWVHARASVSFRECAEDAKHTIKEVTTEVVDAAKVIAGRTWKAAKKFKKQAENAAAEAAARRRNRPY